MPIEPAGRLFAVPQIGAFFRFRRPQPQVCDDIPSPAGAPSALPARRLAFELSFHLYRRQFCAPCTAGMRGSR
jgi:hypothetical protein